MTHLWANQKKNIIHPITMWLLNKDFSLRHSCSVTSKFTFPSPILQTVICFKPMLSYLSPTHRIISQSSYLSTLITSQKNILSFSIVKKRSTKRINRQKTQSIKSIIVFNIRNHLNTEENLNLVFIFV